MPLVAFRCQCGHEYTDLLGLHVAGGEGTKCPMCASETPERLLGGMGVAFSNPDRMYENLDPLTMQSVMAHRAHMEQYAAQRDSGEMNVKEAGPNWSRPFGNEIRRKFY